ncbi:hypothetical protein PS718_04419 [Pseudomonas fluorescens]|uniref:Uncharacterized protein n=1 Tax=Pseudomonas fluorescens TaxID=294 RepID=A0A5E7EAA0_PSEFL|nr:hypothetical protein PS718_04419 [Pseudomonas fluorescens]
MLAEMDYEGRRKRYVYQVPGTYRKAFLNRE